MSGLMKIWDENVVVIDILLKSVTFPALIAMIGKLFVMLWRSRLCFFHMTPHNVTSIV